MNWPLPCHLFEISAPPILDATLMQEGLREGEEQPVGIDT